MILRNLSVVVALSCLIAACSDKPVRKVHPSTASIQQLALQPDGRWKVTLRIQNFSTMSMHYSHFSAKLTLAELDAGEIDIAPDMDIVGNGGDVIDATLKTALKLPASGDFAYQLQGTIDTSEPKASFPFTRASRLSPVPGVPNTYR